MSRQTGRSTALAAAPADAAASASPIPLLVLGGLAAIGLSLLVLPALSRSLIGHRHRPIGRGGHLVLDNQPTIIVSGVAFLLIAIVDWLLVGGK